MRSMLLIVVLLTLPESALSQNPEDKGPQVVSVGKVTKIDAEERWFELRSRVPDRVQTRPGRSSVGLPGPWFGEVHGSIGIGSVRIGVQVGDRRDDVLVTSGDGGTPRGPRYTKSRVYVTGDTEISHNGKPITFEELKVDDQLTVTGHPKGKDMQATEIERRFSLPERFTSN